MPKVPSYGTKVPLYGTYLDFVRYISRQPTTGWQQGGSRVETLPDHRRCCFVGLLVCLPLTDGVCDDVLGVVEGIAGETVTELMQEKKGL